MGGPARQTPQSADMLIAKNAHTGGEAMPNSRKASTLPAMKTRINQEGPKVWTPVYAGRTAPKEGESCYDRHFKNALPVDWTCPCGRALHGAKSCPSCGRVPLDSERKRLDGYQSMDTQRELKRWRKFAKRAGR